MRRPAPVDFLEELPPWPRPLVSDLRHAPELAVLAVLHTALRAALVALAAEHPSSVHRRNRPPCATHADRSALASPWTQHSTPTAAPRWPPAHK
jgi:hypothetical protein